MYKKLLISTAILVITIFTFCTCFAADNGMQDAVNGIRNAVGDAENAVEDGVRDIANTSRDVTGDMEQGANSVGNRMMENGDNNNTAKDTNNNAGTAGMTNGNYTATRTATTGATFMGMNSTAWTWLIIGIAGIAIVALVWYYSMQIRSSNYDDRD